jgi:hypothetical protein
MSPLARHLLLNPFDNLIIFSNKVMTAVFFHPRQGIDSSLDNFSSE